MIISKKANVCLRLARKSQLKSCRRSFGIWLKLTWKIARDNEKKDAVQSLEKHDQEIIKLKLQFAEARKNYEGKFADQMSKVIHLMKDAHSAEVARIESRKKAEFDTTLKECVDKQESFWKSEMSSLKSKLLKEHSDEKMRLKRMLKDAYDAKTAEKEKMQSESLEQMKRNHSKQKQIVIDMIKVEYDTKISLIMSKHQEELKALIDNQHREKELEDKSRHLNSLESRLMKISRIKERKQGIRNEAQRDIRKVSDKLRNVSPKPFSQDKLVQVNLSREEQYRERLPAKSQVYAATNTESIIDKDLDFGNLTQVQNTHKTETIFSPDLEGKDTNEEKQVSLGVTSLRKKLSFLQTQQHNRHLSRRRAMTAIGNIGNKLRLLELGDIKVKKLESQVEKGRSNTPETLASLPSKGLVDSPTEKYAENFTPTETFDAPSSEVHRIANIVRFAKKLMDHRTKKLRKKKVIRRKKKSRSPPPVRNKSPSNHSGYTSPNPILSPEDNVTRNHGATLNTVYSAEQDKILARGLKKLSQLHHYHRGRFNLEGFRGRPIDSNTFYKQVRLLGADITLSEANAVFATYDRDGNGALEYHEFLRGFYGESTPRVQARSHVVAKTPESDLKGRRIKKGSGRKKVKQARRRKISPSSISKSTRSPYEPKAPKYAQSKESLIQKIESDRHFYIQQIETQTNALRQEFQSKLSESKSSSAALQQMVRDLEIRLLHYESQDRL